MQFEDRSLAPYQGQEPYIFLSYSHRNAEAAAETIRWLKAAGFRVWYDEGVIPATQWDENIAQAIENCDYLIALISEAYLSSANCLDELNYARDQNIPMLLVYLEDVSLPSGLAMRLGRLLAIHRYRYDNPAAFYAKVVRSKGIGICGDGRFEEEEEDEDDSLPEDGLWSGETEHRQDTRRSVFRPIFLFLLALAVAFAAFLLLRGWAGERIHAIFGAGDSGYTETLPAPDPTPYPPPETSAEIEIEVTPTPEPSESPEPTPSPSPSAEVTPTPLPEPTVTPSSDGTVTVVVPEPSSAVMPDPTPTVIPEVIPTEVPAEETQGPSSDPAAPAGESPSQSPDPVAPTGESSSQTPDAAAPSETAGPAETPEASPTPTPEASPTPTPAASPKT